MISCICPNCSAEIEFDAGLAGYTVPCPQCEEWVKFPGTKRPWHNPEPMGRRWIELRKPLSAEPTEFEPGLKPPALQPELQPAPEPPPIAAAVPPVVEPPKIRCQCPFCNCILRVPAYQANKEITCLACKGRLIVPSEPAAVPDAPLAPLERAVSWKVTRPPRPRRRRSPRPYGPEEQSRRYEEAQFERGRTMALVITICLLVLTVLDVIGMLRLMPGTTRKFQANEIEFLYVYLGILGLFIAVRVICLFGMLTAQNWARMTLGMLLYVGGLSGIFTIVKDNALLGGVQILINLSFATIILCSASLASYTRG